MQRIVTFTFPEDDSKSAIIKETSDGDATIYDVSYNGKAIGAISFNGFFYIVDNRPYTTMSAAAKVLVNKVL